MHERPEFGVEGQKYAGVTRKLSEELRTRDILDYGCGKCSLEAALGFPIRNYDPCIPGLDDRPQPASIVTCTDVLEHIEPECLDAVLADLGALTLQVCMLVIATKPAGKLLPDGTNPHRIVEQWEWWLPRLANHWRMVNFSDMGKRFMYIGRRRK